MDKVKVLFVCMGNICRSPTAHGVFHTLVEQHGLADRIEIDSAGTHAYHVGEQPDSRAQATAVRRGYDLSSIRARRVSDEDFQYYDYILAMDRDNLSILQRKCPETHQQKLSLFLDFAKDRNENEVPDPYYGGVSGFERVIDMIEQASEGLLTHINTRHMNEN
jgi:protein-tyrosine phosphatase